MADEYADLKQMLQQQLKLMEALTVKLSNSSMGQPSTAGGSQSVDHIAGSITEFLYDPQAHITFDSWYKRYEDLFSVDLAAQDDAWKVRLLLRKKGPAEYERYANFILPKYPREVAFKDTVMTLSQIFGDQSSLFNTRFQCLQLCKRDSDDFITYAGIVNYRGHPESCELLTINTHRGLFQYIRLPFGVKTAPALFQQTMNAMLSGVPGTSGYLDDIIIVHRSPAELTTQIPASPGGVSSAEALMGRKLRTTFHALVPTGAQPAQTSPVSRSKLSIGTPVFVRDYRAGFPDWIEATVVSHRGSMLFDVDVGDDIWVRHHNQIRRRHCSNATGLDSAPSLSLDILLDTFAIPADQSVPESTSAPPSDIPSSVSVTAPVSPGIKPRLRRRTNRVRRSTRLMQVNPRQKRY
nr:unnamed protein product [Spirometra erinaceieuropaei]